MDCLTVADSLAALGQADKASQLYKGAIPTLEKGCERGDFTTCLELEGLYRDGLGVEASADKAGNYRARACSLGAKVACE